MILTIIARKNSGLNLDCLRFVRRFVRRSTAASKVMGTFLILEFVLWFGSCSLGCTINVLRHIVYGTSALELTGKRNFLGRVAKRAVM